MLGTQVRLLGALVRLRLDLGDVAVGVLLGALPLGRDVLVGLALGLGDDLLGSLVGLLAGPAYVLLAGVAGDVDLLGRLARPHRLLGGLGLELLGSLDRGVRLAQPRLDAVGERRGVRDGDLGLTGGFGHRPVEHPANGMRQLFGLRGQPGNRMMLGHRLPSPEVTTT